MEKETTCDQWRVAEKFKNMGLEGVVQKRRIVYAVFTVWEGFDKAQGRVCVPLGRWGAPPPPGYVTSCNLL